MVAGFALVVSPLISLMKDQVDGLRVDGVAASYLNSTLTVGRARRGGREPARGSLPPAVRVARSGWSGEGSQGFRRLLQQCGVRFIAIDEAHCISQWGHDFRPEYRQLGRLRDDFPGVSLHAFTATATERVRRDIVAELRLNDPLVLVGSFDRPNLTYRVLRRGNLHRQLRSRSSRGHDGEAGIVYCPSRREVESLAAWLREKGIARCRITPACPTRCGAGIRRRFSTSAPTSSSPPWRSAWGSIGRTSGSSSTPARRDRPSTISRNRDAPAATGLPAECVLIYSGADFVRWRQMLETNGELTDSARALLRDMERYAAGHALPSPRRSSSISARRTGAPSCGAVRLVPEGARRRSPTRRSSRRRSCRASRASSRRGASAT